jgi:uncharacterized protein YeeX (DUF496 family)
MRISPQMDEFRQQLLNAYDSTKVKISQDISDEDLQINDDFKRCIIIGNIIKVMFGSSEGYEMGEIAAELDDYDIEKFIGHYSVKITKNEKGKFDFDFKSVNNSTEEGQ